MNIVTKNSLRASLLAATLALSGWAAQPVLAQPHGDGMGMSAKPEQCLTKKSGSCPMMKCKHGMQYSAEHVAKKLDELGTKLHLKDKQQSAWKDYRDFISAAAADHQKQREGMRDPQKRAEMRDLPTPERLQKMADHMQAKADDMDKVAKKTSAFYKQLSPEQQTIFDLYQRDMHPRKHGHHGKH